MKQKRNKKFDHTFSICAYKDSPYLEQCVLSLIRQEMPSTIIMCTSTPSPFIEEIASRYGIQLYIREGKSNICDDWNFAYSKAETEYVTIAHQDDIYMPSYSREIAKRAEKDFKKNTLIYYTNYKLINSFGKEESNKVNVVKSILNAPLLIPGVGKVAFGKRCSLRLGNAVCCPSVCYHKEKICDIRRKKKCDTDILFESHFSYALDWDTFTVLAGYKGSFCYIPRKLFRYRVHEQSTSTACLYNHKKIDEEIAMFSKFWPKPVVKLIMRYYRLSYDVYRKK